ncbi:MAG: hypothetical protein Q7J25_12170 [Vicinamibacterales bacterium]|nr:hypothetical protein [Vicinamibacterales bacterium]
MTAAVVDAVRATRRRAPAWLVAATAAMATLILVLAVVETSITAAWLVDTRGEFISLFGVAFILAAGLMVWRQGRLYPSLPLVLPWLLYPIVTQGDQIIDNLSIDAMRAVCNVLLIAIFAAPVAVVVIAARSAFDGASGSAARQVPRSLAWVPGLPQLASGQRRQGAALLTAVLLVLEIPLAVLFLGALMVYSLAAILVGVLVWACRPEPDSHNVVREQARSERFALGVLVAGVIISAGTYLIYANAPGAYQGSPSFFMDPSQKDKNYPMDRVAVPAGDPGPVSSPDTVRDALTASARAFERLLAGYDLLARNYTWDFHNELFLRYTPLVANYRQAGLALVGEAAALDADARTRLTSARALIPDGDPLAALLDDLAAYAGINFDRSPTLEHMSLSFQKTKAGLQHAAHLYEGEAKYLGDGLAVIVRKHQRVVDAPALSGVMREFVLTSRAIHEAYADRIVGY